MIMAAFNTFAETYQYACWQLHAHPEFITSPRGQKIHELVGSQLRVLNPYSNMFKNEERSLPQKYLRKELLLYFNSIKSTEAFTKASSFWKQLTNDDGTINSSYGYLIFGEKNEEGLSQWQWAQRSLIKDKDSRQAIMYLCRTSVQRDDIKDFICTISYQFLIRDNQLWLIVNRRSQDIFFGLTFDGPWEMLLMQQMRLHLLDTYPELKLGSYVLNCGSLHMYERNFEKIKNMLDRPFIDHKTPKISEDCMLIDHTGESTFAMKAAYTGLLNNEDPFFNWLIEKDKKC